MCGLRSLSRHRDSPRQLQNHFPLYSDFGLHYYRKSYYNSNRIIRRGEIADMGEHSGDNFCNTNNPNRENKGSITLNTVLLTQ